MRSFITFLLLLAFPSTMPIPVQAGDILRGGTSVRSADRNAQSRSQVGAEAAQAAKVRAQDRLARTTKAVNDMRALQAAARAAANSNHIPNGLAEGGLKVLTGPNAKWQGASAPIQSGNTVAIQQTASQALLHWETFHVGRDTKVNFDQSAGGADAGKWIAFNKVFDPAAKPSEIRGKINAQGQVYIINQNGIIFGAGSQVKTRTLVASSLPLNDNLVSKGILNNKDAQFLFSGLKVPGGSDGSPAFTPDPLPGDARYGDLLVERGARISISEGEGGNGGRAMLVGANIRNEGEISTPSGQTILAAGLQVGVRAHAENDPSLRGLDVWVGQVGDYSGTIWNEGLIETQRGSIMVVGKAINQNGAMEGSTSVNLNGRIDLLASYGAAAHPDYDKFSGSSFPPFLNQNTGIVNFGPSSTTRILPDFSSETKIPGTRLPQSSQVNVEGIGIHFEGGSALVATSGDIRIRAGIWPFKDLNGDGTSISATGGDEPGLNQQFVSGSQKFLFSGGQVNLAPGALIDASGTTDVLVPLAQNFLAVQLRGSELADSPLQRSSDLRGKPLWIDLRRAGSHEGRGWIGTPLGDLTGIANITERGVDQLTTRGGSISISAGDSMVASTGSSLDVSGGYLLHEGGEVRTTRLLRGGAIVDMHNAFPDVEYDGIYEGYSVQRSTKWGVSKTYSHALAPVGGGLDEPQVEGAPAGTLSITSPKMEIGAELLGTSTVGPRQQFSPPGQGKLQIRFQGETSVDLGGNNFAFQNHSPATPHVIFSNDRGPSREVVFELAGEAPVPLPFASGSSFVVRGEWLDEKEGGFGNISIDNSEGDITVPDGSALRVPAGGSVALAGRNVLINADVIAPGGSFTATAYNYTPLTYARDAASGTFAARPAPAPLQGQGKILVAEGVLLDVAGAFVDERSSLSTPAPQRAILRGGNVVLNGYSISLARGSLLDASGGARALANGKFAYGNAGSISLLAGRDPALATSTGGELLLGGTLQAYSALKGGSLALQSDTVQIGGRAGAGTLLLPADFFRKGGFTSFSIAGIGSRAKDGSLVPGILLAEGTKIQPASASWRHIPFAGNSGPEVDFPVELLRSADSRALGIRKVGDDVLFPDLMAEGTRHAASLSLSASGYDDTFTEDRVEAIGIIKLAAGSKIHTDAGASVRISGDFVAVSSEISTPGGLIEISGRSSFRFPQAIIPNQAFPTVHLDSGSSLSVAGKTIPIDDSFGWNAGAVHPGGTIRISGNVFAEAGSALDSSGATAVLDFHPWRLNSEIFDEFSQIRELHLKPWQNQSIATRVDTDGGWIDLSGAEFLYVDSRLSGAAGGPSALGGGLSVSSGRFYPSGEFRTGADTNLFISAEGGASRVVDTAALSGFAESLLSSKTPDDFFSAIPLSPIQGSQGTGFFSIDRFAAGGFDFLDLGYKFFENASPIPIGGNLEFLEPVSIAARGGIRLAAGGVIRSSFPVSIKAPRVALGQEFRAPLNPADQFQPFWEFNPGTGGRLPHNPAPLSGTGVLNVSSTSIDLGTLIAPGTSKAVFDAGEGEIRGNGIISITGTMSLSASQIYPTTAAEFDLFAYDGSAVQGALFVRSKSTPPLPLSAAGRMRLFGDKIEISGNLRAPLGSIQLGWDGTAAEQPENAVVGNRADLPQTSNLNLEAGASLSVSGIDPHTGRGIVAPFGISPDGLTWIDPRGEDITATGLPDRAIRLTGTNVALHPSATIDLRGGGDLIAYRWIPGIGGSSDLLGTASRTWSPGSGFTSGELVLHNGKTWSARRDLNPSDFTLPPEPSESPFWSLIPESYAILPGYSAAAAPFNSFNTGVNSGGLAGDVGFVSLNLRAGEQIQLPESSGLPAGIYTLLPRRYAVLPGAHLVIPQNSPLSPTRAVVTTLSPGVLKTPAPISQSSVADDGSRLVTGITKNHFASTSITPLIQQQFEIVSPAVLASRAEFQKIPANAFFTDASSRLGYSKALPLPRDSASLKIRANAAFSILGAVLAPSVAGGRGAEIDLSAKFPVSITRASTGSLDASVLNSWKADSLLIGAWRSNQPSSTELSIGTDSISLDAPLSAGEIVLASKGSISLLEGSSISATGAPGVSSSILVHGEGTLVRVAATRASLLRQSTTASKTASLFIGANSRLIGNSVILDSSSSSTVDPSLLVRAQNLSLGAGQINVVFDSKPDIFPQQGQLVLQGPLLQDAFSAENLSLQSYSTIDLYADSSTNISANSIEFLSAGMRGFIPSGSTIRVGAKDILLSNPNLSASLPLLGSDSGSLAVAANTLRFGTNAFTIEGFESVEFSAERGATSVASGSLHSRGRLQISTPALSAAKAVSYSLSSASDLDLSSLAGTSVFTPGLGARMEFSGSTVGIGTDVFLPSGSLRIHATEGSVNLIGSLSTAGSRSRIFDTVRQADAGDVEIVSSSGDVNLAPGSLVSVRADAGGGDAGRIAIRAPRGFFHSDGQLNGEGSPGALGGSFLLDAESVLSFDALAQSLRSAGLDGDLDLRIRNGDIDIHNNISARNFLLSADEGSIMVRANIDVSGETAGRIELVARNSIILSLTGALTAAGMDFSNSGKGGHIHLAAGSTKNGVANPQGTIDLQGGSLIDLSVLEYRSGGFQTPGSSAFLGNFQGTLSLRAPRIGNDVAINALESSIFGASAVSIEPFRVYEPAGGILNIALRDAIHSDSTMFIDAAESVIRQRLLVLGGPLKDSAVITPGVEIINRTGDLTLGLANNSEAGSSSAEALSTADWDLSSFRYGSRSAPGVLTLRAARDLVFNNTLSDGFAPQSQAAASNGYSRMWLAAPQMLNPELPANLQSWTYRLTAGTDLGSSSHRRTAPPENLGVGTGSILIGEFYKLVPNVSTTATGKNGQTSESIRISTGLTNRGTRFEVVRTGTGDIDMAASGDIQLRNPFATVYTSGIGLPNPTRIFEDGDFSVPVVVRPNRLTHPDQGNLGAVQQSYAAHYTFAGGSLSISAGGDIGRFTQSEGLVVPDSSLQLPTNWLYRRAQVDPSTGLFAEGGVGSGGLGAFTDPSASTTWWVDFSNFFSGFGALGGGSVSLSAGRDLVNADTAVPTNARMAGLAEGLRISPSFQNLHEIGGGDLSLRAGRNIDGGSFHVEKGFAVLSAAGEITTNSARSPSRGLMAHSEQEPLVYDPLTWQPIYLFGSRSDFQVRAGGNILLGPVTDAFLLPQGINNKFWYKTQFNIIDPAAGATTKAFGGTITHRLSITLPGDSMAIPVLEAAYLQASALSPDTAGFYRPWLRLSELNPSIFRTASTVSLPSIKSTAHGGDINVVGGLNLFPSPQGAVELLAAGQISGLNPSGATTSKDQTGSSTIAWITSKINLSDADPESLPRIMAPYSTQTALTPAKAREALSLLNDSVNPFTGFDRAFSETGAFTGPAGLIDVKSTLHRFEPVHSGNSKPLHLYAGSGDLTGLTLYSAKPVRAHAGNDITDIAFYLQHPGEHDISVVSAGRDVIPFNENSIHRTIASNPFYGNILIDESMDTVIDDASGNPVKTQALPGDIQVGGQGVLEVIAGRNVDLGTGPNLTDGRGKGITSIGRSKNPFLPFEGSELVVMAGVGGVLDTPALGLAGSNINFSALGPLISLTEGEALVAVQKLFKILTRVGTRALESGNYSGGLELLKSLFPSAGKGDVITRARDIRTASGGSITIAAPGGGVRMASDIFGNPLTPPGIVTEYGGSVSILTNGDVDIGQARIFTLRGGDLTVWSTKGNIAAGNSPKTIVTAPPTRVLIDATSADIQTDLGGLATGGGIGVLAAVKNVEAGTVNLIAPQGTVDAGDAGIRATGDIKIAANAVVNADNIAAGGTSAGVPSSASVSAPNIGGLSSGSASAAASSSAASQVAQQAAPQEKTVDETPSMISVEILGYGGGGGGPEAGDEDEASAEG